MYTFVFLWTPALSPHGEHIPHGMIFACFMVASMAGSALAGRLLSIDSRWARLALRFPHDMVEVIKHANTCEPVITASELRVQVCSEQPLLAAQQCWQGL